MASETGSARCLHRSHCTQTTGETTFVVEHVTSLRCEELPSQNVLKGFFREVGSTYFEMKKFVLALISDTGCDQDSL